MWFSWLAGCKSSFVCCLTPVWHEHVPPQPFQPNPLWLTGYGRVYRGMWRGAKVAVKGAGHVASSREAG